jgi:hypothetical protein
MDVPDQEDQATIPGGSLPADNPYILDDSSAEETAGHLEDEWSSIRLNVEAGTGPTPTVAAIRLGKLRAHAAGRSAAGISVLATSGWLGSTEERKLDLRLDSCADVTLLSEKFWLSMKERPKLKRGVKM